MGGFHNGFALRRWLWIAGNLILFILFLALPCFGDDPGYVGMDVCRQCHEEQYVSFTENSKKAKSFSSIEKMKRGLTPEEIEGCYGCHTTGYGGPGGFVSAEETPHLKHAGCEVCHGPGSIHAESEDPDDIKGALTVEDCESCHNEARIGAFNYKPMIYGGGH